MTKETKIPKIPKRPARPASTILDALQESNNPALASLAESNRLIAPPTTPEPSQMQAVAESLPSQAVTAPAAVQVEIKNTCCVIS